MQDLRAWASAELASCDDSRPARATAPARPPGAGLPAALRRVPGLELRRPDGDGGRRLAGLRDQPQRARPRPDRARRVRAAAALRAPGRPPRRPDVADAPV